MNEMIEQRWKEFDELGEIGIRKDLATNVYGEERKKQALQWLALRESADSSTSRRETLALATEANNLARSANEAAISSNETARAAASSALESADAARTNNIIATMALIAAILAIALSIIDLFLKK